MFSIITPNYEGSNKFIEETYDSLLGQTVTEWQWVVVLNNGGVLSERIKEDTRVKIVDYKEINPDVAIGFLKRLACENSDGDIIVELDSDDMLTEDCLAELQKAFDEHPNIPFIYSNDAEFNSDDWTPNCYSAYWGWENRPFEWHGHNLLEQCGMLPTPNALRSIYWAPNHVRAWRTKDYWEVGGHNPAHGVVDDYDLVCRFYLHADMFLIDKCLYLYRRHGTNTTFTRNAEIQEGNQSFYPRYIIPMVETWGARTGKPMIDLGGGFNKPAGYISLDKVGADVSCDLEKGIPYPDNSVSVVRAYDFLEHVNAINIMNEIYRVLIPGGWLLASIPSTDGRGAFQDPTHISFWNENSMMYYTDPNMAAFVRDIKCKFQTSRTITHFPTQWHKEHNVSYIDTQLIAVKDGYKPIGESLWPR
jgi:glycosyltransferase involved in cell wall biosynthesis